MINVQNLRATLVLAIFSLQVSIINSQTITTFPFTESFENDFGEFIQGSGDDLDWSRDANGTPSNNTGPDLGADGNYYLYVEASNPNHPSKTAYLETPRFDLSNASGAAIHFQNHMYGSSSEMNLEVEASIDGGSNWSSALWTQTGDQGNQWNTVSLNLDAYLGELLTLRFVGTTGETWRGDIAIDDIVVEVVACSGIDEALIGTPCDDGDASTIGDVYDATCSCVGTPAITASLETYLNDYIDNVPGRSGDDFNEPNASELVIWEDLIAHLLNDNISAANTLAATFNYQVSALIDNATGSDILYYILEEKDNPTKFWGTYVFNLQACRSGLVLQAPHLKFDSNTGKQAVYSFARLDALALFLNGTHRCNSNIASSCDGTTEVCSSPKTAYRIADMAHNVMTAFQKTTEVVFSNINHSVFIQLHGFGKQSTDPYLIMSNGSRQTPVNDPIATIRDELFAVDNSLTFKIAHIDLSWTRHIGFTNTQGRFINGSSDPCEDHVDASIGRFVHIEQEKTKLREDVSGWNKMYVALANSFECITCPELGLACDDGDDCTTDDIYDSNCNCVGTFQDDDGDGVCDANDQCPGTDDALIGSACDDSDVCTTDDVYGSNCDCVGTFQDSDNDSVCDANDQCPGTDDALIGTACDDGDDCTTDDIYDSNCNCVGTFQDADGDGVCDADDVCPGGDDAVDDNNNGTPDACEGCTYALVDFNNFDNSWGIWNDGGSDCRRSSNDAVYSNGGTGRSVRLRDNTSTSVMTTDILDISNYEEVTVNFNYYPRSMDNSNEDFWLQISTDGGSTYTTVEEWNQNDEFVNDTRYFENIVISGPFTNTTRLRFRCDASGNSDWVYIDDVEITGCSSGGESVRENANKPLKQALNDNGLNSASISFEIYPNPFQSSFTMTIKDLKKSTAGWIRVINVDGKIVFNKWMTFTESSNVIEFNEALNGHYFIQLITDDIIVTKPIIKL